MIACGHRGVRRTPTNGKSPALMEPLELVIALRLESARLGVFPLIASLCEDGERPQPGIKVSDIERT